MDSRICYLEFCVEYDIYVVCYVQIRLWTFIPAPMILFFETQAQWPRPGIWPRPILEVVAEAFGTECTWTRIPASAYEAHMQGFLVEDTWARSKRIRSSHRRLPDREHADKAFWPRLAGPGPE